MNIIRRKNFYYLRNSFKKHGKVVTREIYLSKKIPDNIDELKDVLLRRCFQEEVYLKLHTIKANFLREWRQYPKSIRKKVLLDLSINFTYNTNAIEGSTITNDETEDLLKHRISPNKSIEDVTETINHSKTFLTIIQKKGMLNGKTLLEWHSSLFSDTKHDIAGKWRDYSVKVGDYRAPDWQDIPTLLKRFFTWIIENKHMQPVELAARAHYKFEKIHPFGDGNGRIGRLIIAQLLRNSNYPLIVLSYKKRRSYYRALEKTERDFVQYFMRRYISSFKNYLK